MISIVVPVGSIFSISGAAFLTRSATSTVLAMDCLERKQATMSFPSTLMMFRGSFVVSLTRATSRRSMAWPFRTVMAMFSISSGLLNSPRMRIWNSDAPSSRRPAVRVRFSAFRACDTWSTGMW